MYKFFILILLLSVRISAQKIKGKVIDSGNSIEINDVQIFETNNDIVGTSNSDGLFELPNTGIYIFSKQGFFSKTMKVKNSKFFIVELISHPENLEEIQITASNFQSDLKTLASAISVIPAKTIESNNGINIAPILNSVSGVFMHNGTLNTNRITIRGIGSRNLYGTSKIRAYYQDIPLTNGSGESTIEDLEMNTLGRIEILKGPSSSVYGAGLGGTIQLIPFKGNFDQVSAKGGYLFGSFGLQKFILETNLGDHSNSAIINYTNTRSDGYRANNELNRQVVSVASNHFLSDKDRITFIGSYIDLKAFIPSSLNEDDYINNPTTAAFTWGRAKGYEDYKKGLFGASWHHNYNSKTKQITSIFTSFFNSYEARPFNILKESANAIGLRTRVLSEINLFNKPLKWTIGGEIFKDKNSYQTFENLYKDFPPEIGSVQGELLNDLGEKRTYFNLFFDSNWILFKNTRLSLGFNINQTSYKLEDNFISDNKDLSGNYRFDGIFSPKLGLTHQFNDDSMIYGTISHGFSPPTLEETLLPDGMINDEIKPESGWNYEIGTRGRFINKIFKYDIALYHMNVKNLLVARRTSDDQFIGVNAGKTAYTGLEISLNFDWIKNSFIHIYHSNAWSINNFLFKEFKELDNDYGGNKLTGVPKSTFYSQLHIDSKTGLYGFISFNHVGEIPMRDDNSIFSDSYQVINTKIGYRTDENKILQFDLFFGINNLFDEKYASMLLINAGSFGNNAPRYYYPGEPINYYSGLNIKYSF